ncbi:hypothetical protein EV144_106220 [Flavobacterium sp. 270]|uniref:hypothetical protein n=1 Tax=Flavobacterium sp. 270 TaxID=2512114 RepID=UPI001064A53B|nr:hypothetical protein [Flavobacterium sp. 270]TDW46548.1 hypothetical protein EV144_106220 [Flavobacterium sp. 270]
MSNYLIEKKLLLKDIEEITISEEKVLVRGADEIIKEVDKSSFGGGNVSGTPNILSKFNSNGNGLEDSPITIIGSTAEITSSIANDSGLKFTNLKNSISYTPIARPTSQSFPRRTAHNKNTGDIAIIFQSGNKLDVLDKNGDLKFSTILSTQPTGLIYDDSDNLYLVVTNNDITKIDKNFNITENFSNSGGNPYLYFASGLIYCLKYDGSAKTVNINNGETQPYGNGFVHPSSTFALGDSGEIYSLATDGIYKSEGTEKTLFYLPEQATYFSKAVYKDGVLYALNYTNQQLIALNSNGSVILTAPVGIWPQDLIFTTDGNIIVYSNYSSMFISDFRLVKPSGESEVIFNKPGTNFNGLYSDLDNNLYGVSWSSGFWGKFIYTEKNYLLALDNNGKVVGLNKKDFVNTIDLKSVLNSNSEAYFGNYDFAGILYGSDGDREVQFQTSVDNDDYSNFRLRKDFWSILGTSSGSEAGISSYEGNIKLTQKNSSSNGTILEFEQPIAIGGSANIKIPAKAQGDYILATTEDLSISGSYNSIINDNSTNVNNPGNTFIEKIYYTKTGKNVYCSASVSIDTNTDTSNDLAYIQVTLPFPQSSTFPRLNAGNGILYGGGLGNLIIPAIIQLEGTNNTKIIFSGKSGDNGSSYQGEVHWSYETD